MNTPLLALDAENVDVRLGRPNAVQILSDVSLAVHRGSIVALIGETGSGKTTLARTILGLNRSDRGTITVGEDEVTALSGRALRQFRREGKVQYVFQDPLRSLDPDLTVRASVRQGLIVRPGYDPAEVKARVEEVVGLVGLDLEHLDRYPSELSGGQRQRVAIARAMAVRPDLLICDEPVSALDASSRANVLRLLRFLARETAVGILLITHDIGSLGTVADEIAVLYRGRIVEAGRTQEILTQPLHAYTQLLLASVPTLDHPLLDPARRHHMRAELEAEFRTTH